MKKLALSVLALIFAFNGTRDQEYRMDSVRLYLIGDVMMHSPQFKYDCNSFFRDISGNMGAADLCVANMEFSLGGRPYSGYPRFSAPDHIADYMASLGTDVFLTANNHIVDRNAAGIDRTVGYYDRLGETAGTSHTGTGHEPLILDVKGFRLALVNLTYGTNGLFDERVNYMTVEIADSMMKKAAEKGADFVIVLPHWGFEYHLKHSADQQKWAEHFVEKGADVIVGSHPHVVQDTSHVNGIPVIYSMGNAVSNMDRENTRLALAVSLCFVRDVNGIKKMLEPRLEFLWCTLPGKLTESYATVRVREWENRREEWKDKSDYDNMIATRDRVRSVTRIEAL
ncbi:MAG: CapA family protein [Bacteroidales bacterium]|nr:CapA family protein [Bacteroidales bacterium]